MMLGEQVGQAKRNLAFTRLRLRGLTGAKDEFLLTATVQNLKRPVKHAIRPPPRPMFACSMRQNHETTGHKDKNRPGDTRRRKQKVRC